MAEKLHWSLMLFHAARDGARERAERARDLALHWGSDFELLIDAGHINVASGHQRWIPGLRYLARISREPARKVLATQSASFSPHLLGC